MKNKVQDLNLSSGMQTNNFEKEFQLDYTSTPLKQFYDNQKMSFKQ